MRIAVTGTHCSGKTTLIDDFVEAYPEYRAEPEPYDLLNELGEEFPAQPSAEDFLRQLETGLTHWSALRRGDRVICERSPYDFLAYLRALTDLGREDAECFDTALEWVRDAGPLFDLVVYLPLGQPSIRVSDAEDPELRAAMDAWLGGILVDDSLGLLDEGAQSVCVASGPRNARLDAVRAHLG
jgi:hypothetical protein